MLSKEQIQTICTHVGAFVGEVIKEDDKSVTVALIAWAMDGDIKHEFTYCILKDEIIERRPIIWKQEDVTNKAT